MAVLTEFEEAVMEIYNRRTAVPSAAKKYECEICKDIGSVMVVENGIEIARQCKCYKLRQARELMERSGISQEFQKKSFDNFDTKHNPQLESAKNQAVKYAGMFAEREHDRQNSIIFSGQVGSGKTHLGTAISGYLMNHGIAVVYMAYRNAVTKIKQHVTDEERYSREVSLYSKARVLYIDDLLKGRLTETDVNIMYEIINYRYMNNLPVIISTEKSLEELLEFDEAVGSRMIEMCRGNIVTLQGKDLNYRLFS